jgi:hypothetical protein
MNRRLFGLLAAVLAVGIAACVSDPTDELSGEPDRIVTSLNKVFLQPGDSVLVTAELQDAQGVPLPTLPEVTSADPAVVGVILADVPPLSVRRFYVKSLGAGTVAVNLTAGGVSETITVVAYPSAFSGSVAVATGGLHDTVTITADDLIGFDAEATTVTINGGSTYLVSRTATEIKVLALDAEAVSGATVTLHDAVFLPGTEDIALTEVAADQTVNISGDATEPGNSDAANAIPLTLGTPFVSSISGTDTRDYLVFTLAAAGVIQVTAEFIGTGGNPDIDFYIRDAALASVSGNAMGTGAQPETWTSGTLVAGTYYVRVDWYDSGDDPPPHWYRVTVILQ